MARDCGNSSVRDGFFFSRFVVFELGDIVSIHFWHDVWCNDFPLKFVYPEMFMPACSIDAFVVCLLSLGYFHVVGGVFFACCTRLRNRSFLLFF